LLESPTEAAEIKTAMNFFKRLLRLFGGKKVALHPPEGPVIANLDWHSYRTGEGDKAGRKIEKVYALDDRYIIYFADHIYSEDKVGCELFYETTPELAKDLGNADAALAGINRLLDDVQTKGSHEYNFNFSTLELAADAFEMFFCGEKTEALEILKGIHDKLQAKEEGQRRLTYQLGALLIAALVWSLYLWLHGRSLPAEWDPWILAAALAIAGGLFSVCLNVGSLEVNVNQQPGFLLSAGATRAVVAFLAGIGLLLAMRSKMFAGITYEDSKLPLIGEPLTIAEMFFCFLAGFSEAFVPNILSKDADAKSANAKPAADKVAAPTKGQPDDKLVDKK
jgi:hypothetical protein